METLVASVLMIYAGADRAIADAQAPPVAANGAGISNAIKQRELFRAHRGRNCVRQTDV
jgi:hypothetical protein